MHPPLVITSSDNPTIKLVKALKSKRDRDTTGLFLIEGYRELFRAITHHVFPESILYCPALFLGSNEMTLLKEGQKNGAKLIELPESLFTKISYRDRPDGLIAISKKMDLSSEKVLQSLQEKARTKAPFIVIAEAIEKPGNLGTILRSSDASGVDAVIIANGCTDIYNPNVVRASTGTLFTIPVLELSNQEALDFAKKLNVMLIAASPEGSTLYTDIPMTGPIGIIVGTEQIGLSSFWKQEASLLGRIPMHGASDSLNVATATTLFLFEAVRQRNL